MSKEYYQRQIVELRYRIQREKDAKKSDNESYARQIKNATSASSKASLRQAKISRAAQHDRNIESLKKQVATAQYNKARESR